MRKRNNLKTSYLKAVLINFYLHKKDYLHCSGLQSDSHFHISNKTQTLLTGFTIFAPYKIDFTALLLCINVSPSMKFEILFPTNTSLFHYQN